MTVQSQLTPELQSHLTSIIYGALNKLKASMDDGPGGEPASLTPEESAMLYRTLTEIMGIPHQR